MDFINLFFTKLLFTQAAAPAAVPPPIARVVMTQPPEIAALCQPPKQRQEQEDEERQEQEKQLQQQRPREFPVMEKKNSTRVLDADVTAAIEASDKLQRQQEQEREQQEQQRVVNDDDDDDGDEVSGSDNSNNENEQQNEQQQTSEAAAAATVPPRLNLRRLPAEKYFARIKTSKEAEKLRITTRDFDGLDMHSNILRGIYAYGYELPSNPAQTHGIPAIFSGRDTIIQAPAGTGKTGALVIGLLHVALCLGLPPVSDSYRDRMNANNNTSNNESSKKNAAATPLYPAHPRCILLTCSRELALQTTQLIDHIGDYLFPAVRDNPGCRWRRLCVTAIGGSSVSQNIRALQDGPAIVVGNAGRVLDLLKRGALSTPDVTCLVLDEADDLLSQHSQETIYDVFQFMPRTVQVVLASTTYSQSVFDLTQKFMRDPLIVGAGNNRSDDNPFFNDETTKLFRVEVEEEYKVETLMDLYEVLTIAQCVVFVNTRRKIDWLAEQMNKHNHTVSYLHADMPLGEREQVMKHFREGHSRLLITGDVMARGIDVQHVNIIVNFDLPTTAEAFVHRMGRCGRYGRRGAVISFESARDKELMAELERALHVGPTPELPLNFAQHLA